MTTSRINAYRWPARLVSHKPFAAERYFITSSSIWQVFFAENYDFSFFYFLCFVNGRIFCARCTISALFAGGKLPRSPLQHQYGRERRGLYLLYRELPPSKPVGVRPLRLLTTFASTSPKGRGKSTAGIFLVSPNTLATGFKSWLSLRGKTSPAPGEDVTVGDKRGNLSPQATEGVIPQRRASAGSRRCSCHSPLRPHP